MTPRELRLRQRIDDLMDRYERDVEKLRCRLERAEKQKRRLENRLRGMRQSRDMWRRRREARRPYSPSTGTYICPACSSPKTLQAQTCLACYVEKRRSPEWREKARQWQLMRWEEVA